MGVVSESGIKGREGQVITAHSICEMQYFVPALDAWFWHNTPDIYTVGQNLATEQFQSKSVVINPLVMSGIN